MIAAGLLGALSLVMMNISREGVVVQKRSETAFEIHSISNIITQILLSSDACTATLGVGTNIANDKVITDIRNRDGNSVYNTSTKYGNNTVQINSMRLTDLNLAGSPGDSERSGEVNLEIVFEKLSKVVKGQKTLARKFILNVQVDSSENLIKCHSAVENAVATAKQITCQSIGGVFDAATENCNLRNFNPADALANHLAVSTQHLSDAFNHRVTNELDPKYVDVIGDTMTGKLTVNNEIESNNTLTANRVNSATQVCVGGRCRNFNQAPCPTGQVVRTINEDGTVVCSNVTCADPNTFYVGVNASGNPICKAFPTNTCGANQYVSRVNADGSVVCSQLPPGTNKDCSPGAIQTIDSAGNHTCTNSIPNDKNVFNKSCAVSETLRGFDSLGNPICESGSSLPPLYSCPDDSSGLGSNGYNVKITKGCNGQISLNPTCRNTCSSHHNACWHNGYRSSYTHTLNCTPL